MKKFISFFLVFSLFWINLSVSALTPPMPPLEIQLEEESIIMFINENEVFVNGIPSKIDENSEIVPFIESGRTLVPLRFVAEQFLGEVFWDGEAQTINIKIDENDFLFQIGSHKVYYKEEFIEIEAPPVLKDGRTFVPLRAIAENIGKSLYYRNNVIIISKNTLQREFTAIEYLSEEEQDEFVNSLKSRTFFNEKEEASDKTTSIDFCKNNPFSKNAMLKTDNKVKLNIYTAAPTSEFDKKTEENNIEISGINGSYFLDKENNLYWLYVRIAKNYILDFKLERADIIDFHADEINLITLSENGQVKVSKKREFNNEDEEKSEKNNKSQYVRREVYDIPDAKAVYTYDDVCFVIKNDGSLWGWGKNANGQLGDGTKTGRSLPVKIEGVENVAHVTSRLNHTLCITEDGSLYAWGLNDSGRLGNNLTYNTLVPTKMESISDVIYAVTDEKFTLAVKKDGTVWGIGDNRNSQLGETEGRIFTARAFTKIDGMEDVLYVGLSLHSLVAITKNGQLYEWGITKSGKPRIADKGLYIAS